MGSVHLFALFHFSNEHLLTPPSRGFFIFLLNILGFPCKMFFGKWQFGKATAQVAVRFWFFCICIDFCTFVSFLCFFQYSLALRVKNLFLQCFSFLDKILV